jgi:tetratricopeptide (TPR) repeat protein
VEQTARRIRTVSLISEEPYGQVFVGMDEKLRRQVVVKKLAAAWFEDDDSRNHLIDEARILSRLDHPNLLRIHGYTEHGGYDVFTLEYAPGTKLSVVAAGLDFAAKVRVATAVVDGLAVAHRNGVVHGAFSADSVLIADGGEVKVIDFASTSTRLEGPRAEARWRSPEELVGEERTSATDMWAFGLLLRDMFGDGDHDVRAIVASLLRAAPADRATAAVTLEALQRLGQRRMRRLRTASIAAAVALLLLIVAKYTVDLRRERAAAVAAQAEAESRRAQANSMLAFMILDLRPKLDSVGRLDIMDAASAKALTHFASLRPEEMSPAEAAVNVQALIQLAQTQQVRANLRTALTTFRRAVTMADNAVRRYPDDQELLYVMANAHATLSNALDRDGDAAGALLQGREFAAAASVLAHRNLRDVRFVRNEAYAHSLLATLFDRAEQIDASLGELQTALAIKRRTLPMENTDQARFDLVVTIAKAGVAQLRLGRFTEARVTLDEGRVTLEEVLARQAQNKRMRELLAICYENLAKVAFATGDLESAARLSATHLATAQQLAAYDPANMDWARALVVAHRASGTVARMRGDIAGALRHHAAAVEALGGAVPRGKESKLLLRELAATRVEWSHSLLASGSAAAASEQADRAVEALTPMRGDLQAQKILGEALLAQGEARAARGDAAGADAVWQDALRLLDSLDALSPDPRIADAHARVLIRLRRREAAQPVIDQLAALGYRNPEFEALIGEKALSSKHATKVR